MSIVLPSHDDQNLFIIQATSPNPKHTQWMKQRPEALLFILTCSVCLLFSLPLPIEDAQAFETRAWRFSFPESITYVISVSHSCTRAITSNLKIHDSKLDEDDIKSLSPTTAIICVLSVRFSYGRMWGPSKVNHWRRSHRQIPRNSTNLSCPRQPGPTDSGNHIPQNSVSRSFASQNLIRSHGFHYLQSVQDLGHLFSTCPYTATTGGWLWECQCHLTPSS